MNSKKEIFNEIDKHLMNDNKPSEFIKNLFENEKISKTYPFTMLSDLKKVEQNKKYHPEGDVFTHTLMVVDEAASRRNKSKNQRVFMWAALLHDIGKAPTTAIRNGKITSYEHEKVGRRMAVDFLRELTDNQDFIKGVASMVRWHMEALFVIKNMAFSSIGEMLKEVSLYEIALLNLCDRLGRGDMTYEKARDEIRGIKMFVKKCKEYKMHNRLNV
ncbi:HDIG domain-containing protein [Caloramator quimbayensis]|uniref:HDIG domain-containing protein n=1 Tax=Caloramator quimbayensis TaxID=1147123 RepID=A0A1T4WT88_9CLOT|nr:HDIG domain-containing metalloprotein [Caloramator quimbayensis]SKA80058.1 HDIG domain-containing protein [Caloramator quimbayensis]